MNWQLPIGAAPDATGVTFRVWASGVQQLDVVIMGEERRELAGYPLSRDAEGYFSSHVDGLRAGGKYMYRLDGAKLRGDPASRYQPEGVHGPSQVVDPAFEWQNSATWQGLPLSETILYEVHIGTATPQGTFEAFIEKLPYLKELGVNTIEIMPVGDFPGDRNWGYDGVCLFAPARAYGGAVGLKRLVDAAHGYGLAVVQDVVYNHLGPDGNYLRDFSRDYFTPDKKTPWGDALDYANPAVRDFFINNALYWAHEYRMDGLRLDATHAILDDTRPHILADLPARLRATLPAGRYFNIFAEDERNTDWLLIPAAEGGAGLDAVWADDFHHEVRSALAGDNEGYYADFTGSAGDLAETLTKGWFYTGQASLFSGKARGRDASRYDPPHFVYCIQNHDQIGNRAIGDRLSEGIGLDAYRAAAGLLLLSPYTPLLFQGQEYAASTPFLFFTDFNEDLGKLVTKGRREEFAYLSAFSGDTVPDPQAVSTFEKSKLDWTEPEKPGHRETLALYRDLFKLRRTLPRLREVRRANFKAIQIEEDALAFRFYGPDTPGSGQADLLVVVNLKGDLNFKLSGQEINQLPAGWGWQALLTTDDPAYGGGQLLGDVQALVETGYIRASSPVTYAFQSQNNS
jgi:maltooligosyltrehalose trehalohydrolase